MRRFNEASLEQVVVEHLEQNGFVYVHGDDIDKDVSDVLLRDDLNAYLSAAYPDLTVAEKNRFIKTLDNYSAGALYESNREILRLFSDGVLFRRDDPECQDVVVRLADYTDKSKNIFKVVNQFEIKGFSETRIPDVILFINGIPVVVFELKTVVNEDVRIEAAFKQVTVRYVRDIPELFKYNAFVVISDGVNSKVGTIFANQDNFYAWRTKGDAVFADGIKSMYTMLDGLFQIDALLSVLRDFIYFPDKKSDKQLKIVCRYPQFYATHRLFQNVVKHVKIGDGKGGTYFGATGCGKSFTMLYLTRMLMRSAELNSPTIVIVSDRLDLDRQLSEQFMAAKKFVGDDCIEQVESRADLCEKLKNRTSGGVFMTTVQKFTEETDELSNRSNIICISDEAHRSQVNLDKKIRIKSDGVDETYGFAYHLRRSLPNATYVGFTGTPIDATLDVFGDVVDSYSMTEAVEDGITVRIVYEGRAAKVATDNEKLALIEQYYEECEQIGSNKYQIEESKRKSATIKSVLGHPDRLKAIATDFIDHYENRVSEGASVKGKAMFVCSDRDIACRLYQIILEMRPQWNEKRKSDNDCELTEAENRDYKPIEKIKLVMTYNKDDPAKLYTLLKNDDKADLATQFKQDKSNFKIAIVVDMWLTGFDVPALDTMYIDKYVHKHTLIQTISRVNRVYTGKQNGLVVDYIGIQKAMGDAIGKYGDGSSGGGPQETDEFIKIVKDQLDLLNGQFYQFDSTPFFEKKGREQLDCLNDAAEFIMRTSDGEKRFMWNVKRLRSAYNACVSSDKISQSERDLIHFYMAVRSVVFKTTGNDTPDIAKMNERVRQLVCDALISSDVEDIFKLGDKTASIDLFSPEYLQLVLDLKRPNTRVQVLERLLKNAIYKFREVNRIKAVDFTEKLNAVLSKYNDRSERADLKEIIDDLIDLIHEIKAEQNSFEKLGIDFEEKAFYDILKACADKYGFDYPEDKTIALAREIKRIVSDKARYTNWSKKANIRAALQADLIIVLDENGYPPEPQEEVYENVIEQAENFKQYQAA